MLHNLFYWVLNMSIAGSVMGCIILLLRKIKDIPRFGIYLLWVVPLIRFWLPLGIANKYSLMSLIARVTTRTVVVYEEGLLPPLSFSNYFMAAESYFPLTYKSNLLEGVFRVASGIWAILALGALVAAALLYAFTKVEVKDAIGIRGNICRSDQVLSPTVYGIFRPKIILPPWVDADNFYILEHEQVHIRRRDNLWRAVAIITACLHWFNPLVWRFLQTFFTDMELACDAKVIKDYTPGQRKGYASALLGCSRQRSFFASAFGSAKIRVRIENILSYRKLTLFSSLFFAGLFVAIAIVLLTNSPK